MESIMRKLIPRHRRSFPEGTTLESELNRVMDTLTSAGIRYPLGYRERLIRRYKKGGVRYPRILMRMGEPNIRKHTRYQEILQSKGRLLDYGCGTGDDIRALLADGYPPKKIAGYDIDWSSINMGFDLYLDRDTTPVRFVVERRFPFEPSTFQIVYSGSVLHVLWNTQAVKKYISNAYAVLKPGGILFGSTLGFGRYRPIMDRMRMRRTRRWRRLLWLRQLRSLSESRLRDLLLKTGFSEIEVSQDSTLRHLLFYAKKQVKE